MENDLIIWICVPTRALVLNVFSTLTHFRRLVRRTYVADKPLVGDATKLHLYKLAQSLCAPTLLVPGIYLRESTRVRG